MVLVLESLTYAVEALVEPHSSCLFTSLREKGWKVVHRVFDIKRTGTTPRSDDGTRREIVCFFCIYEGNLTLFSAKLIALGSLSSLYDSTYQFKSNLHDCLGRFEIVNPPKRCYVIII